MVDDGLGEGSRETRGPPINTTIIGTSAHRRALVRLRLAQYHIALIKRY